MNFSYQFFGRGRGGFFTPSFYLLFFTPSPEVSPPRANSNIVRERRRAEGERRRGKGEGGSRTKIRTEFLCRTLEGFGSWKRLVEQRGDISARLFETTLFLHGARRLQSGIAYVLPAPPLFFTLYIYLRNCSARTRARSVARDLYKLQKYGKLQKVEQKCINFRD